MCKHLIRFRNFYGDLSMTGECELTGERCDPVGWSYCKSFQRVVLKS